MKKWACICRMGSIGDDLIASSVLPQFKKQDYMVEVMATAPAHVVFENNPYIDKLTVLKSEHLPSNPEDWQQWFVKRATEYDKFCHLSHSLEAHVCFFPNNTWFWWPASYRRKIADRSYLELTHDICEVPHEYAPAFFPTDDEVKEAQETKIKVAPLAQPVIGWVMAGSRVDKIYPYAGQAVARLIKELGVSIILFGGLNSRDHALAAQIEQHVDLTNSAKKNLFLGMALDDKGQQAEWPLRRSIATLQQCDLVITPDTGLAWGVASRPMPKMMLLGHASPKNITHGWVNTVTFTPDQERVPCWPCHQLHNDASTCKGNAQNTGAACISDTSVETLVATARRLLGLWTE